MSKTLVIRLSSLGDVAMLIPVLYSCAKQYPQEEFLLITKKNLFSMFEHKPVNVSIWPVDAKYKYKGIRGLIRLIDDLRKQNIKYVADTHDVLRSKVIRTYFWFRGKKVAVINKERIKRKNLIRKKHKILQPLKTSFEKYHEVFRSLGYDFSIDFKSIFEFGTRDFDLIKHIAGTKTNTWIGIAPFARHKGKIYPSENMSHVIKLLASDPGKTIFLFGGRNEQSQLSQLANPYSNVISILDKDLTFSTELLLMSYLDAIITMDSGNMHLASLVGIPVISVWGATHPYAGFYGYGQKLSNAVQADLFCRPCSVYGNKPCYRNIYECLELITPEMIASRLQGIAD